MTDDPRQPWGERTPTQRLWTYGVGGLGCAVFTVLWYSGVLETDTALGPLGYVVGPLGVFVSALKVRSALHDRSA